LFLHRAGDRHSAVAMCEASLCSITVELLCDWPKKRFAAALSESCGAVRRRRTTDSALGF